MASIAATTNVKKTPPTYEPCPMHFKVPHGIFIHEATSVAIDSQDNLYCFNRGNMPVLVFNPDGNLIRCSITLQKSEIGIKSRLWLPEEFN